MPRWLFSCIDGHTAGNPVRLVHGGAPVLSGDTMSARRADFLARFDWIRRSLMFEPRGHDMMSGGFIYPALSPDADAAILFIETSGCLPMCGHGTIGIVTFGLEHGLITPRTPGRLTLDVPAGRITVDYVQAGDRVTSVRIHNVTSYLAETDLLVETELGPLKFDIAYGGNFYAIVEPQPGYPGLDALGAEAIVRISRAMRARIRDQVTPVHPLDPTIRGVSHILWADQPRSAGADGRNAVFYGDKAIDRSPCGTGTSARLAQLAGRGRLKAGDRFVHESYIGSRFTGRVEEVTTLAGRPAIRPSIEGQAFATGFNTIWVDQDDPFWAGFEVL